MNDDLLDLGFVQTNRNRGGLMCVHFEKVQRFRHIHYWVSRIDMNQSAEWAITNKLAFYSSFHIAC